MAGRCAKVGRLALGRSSFGRCLWYSLAELYGEKAAHGIASKTVGSASAITKPEAVICLAPAPDLVPPLCLW